MKYYWLRIKDYFSILNLVLLQIKYRWNLHDLQLFIILDIFMLSIIIPIFILNFDVYDLWSMISVSLIYAVVTSCTIFGLILKKSNITLYNMPYEVKYIFNLCKFLFLAYQNSLKEHVKFLNSYNLMAKYNLHRERDHLILRNIFFSVFKLYFFMMQRKNKKSDPYLVDTKELTSLYNNPQFLEFYTRIFFNSSSKTNNQYEHLLIYILDVVLMDLYQKKWFVQYYDEFILFKFIDHMLRAWYDSILNYNLSKIKGLNIA